MADEKKPLGKSSTVTVGLVVIVISAAVFIGITVQKVNANVRDITGLEETIKTLATKDDLDKLETNLKEYFKK